MQQHSDPILRKEIIQLAQSICDQTMSREERDRLESLLKQYPELRPIYLDYLRVHAGLVWRYRTGDAIPTRGDKSLDIRIPKDSSAAVSKSLPLSFDWKRNLLKRWAFSLGISACLFLGLFAWMNHSGGLRQAGVAPLESAPHSVERTRFVATLREATEAVWSGQGRAINVGARIEAGLLRIESGDAEVVFDSGAKLLIAGPAELQLESPLSVFLKKGTVAAHMPAAAVGFTLRTPMSTLIDQGTEFGVVADDQGATEVHVFRGQVDLQYEDLEDGKGVTKKLEMADRHARRIEQPNKIGEQIPFSKAGFGSLALRVAEPIEWKVADGGNGHLYQLVVKNKPITWHEAARAAMNSHFRGLPGHLASITSPEEDAFVISSFIEELPARGVWMGLTDVLREGYFGWVTGEPFEYSNWASWPVQQPDNFQEASWHGGEDYGMYTQFPDKQPWAWNDLSIDSIHETVSAYLVEYEPPLDALRNRSLTLDPVEWRKDQGGNGHCYRLVLALDPTDWETIRRRAAATQWQGSQGHLVAVETEEEMQFLKEHILRVCGIPEIMIGLNGSLEQEDLRWVNGHPAGDLQIAKPPMPTDLCYGMFRWDASQKWPQVWGVQALAKEVLPADWFGYLIEYPVDLPGELY